MTPKETNFKQEHDLFRLELANMGHPTHALVKLADQIDWPAFSSEFGELYVEGRGILAYRSAEWWDYSI